MLITRRLEFDAGHRIPDHKSQCRHLHGHRYAIEITLSGSVIDKAGDAANGAVAHVGLTADAPQATIKAYPNSPARENALVILIKSYDAMGMKDLRDDTERVMRANFPNSRYFKPDAGDADKPWWKFW